MRRTIQVAAAIIVCVSFFILHAGCGGSDDPADPGGGCGIDITFPAAGSSFLTGETVNLRWDASGGGEVRVTLVKAGLEQGEIEAATGNDGYLQWTVSTMGATSGDDFGLAVTHTTQDCADTLAIELVNTAGCGITTTFLPENPARTDTVQAGDDYEITWESENTTGTVDVELWFYSGLVERVLIATLVADTPDDGSFLWENVDSFHNGTSNNYYIRIADADVDGCEAESRLFRMEDSVICEIDVLAPGAGGVYDEGDDLLIRFTAANGTGAVDLYLYEGMVNLVEYIAYDVSTHVGEYTWTIAIPDDYAGSLNYFRVKLVDADDPYCVTFSQSFTINPTP